MSTSRTIIIVLICHEYSFNTDVILFASIDWISRNSWTRLLQWHRTGQHPVDSIQLLIEEHDLLTRRVHNLDCIVLYFRLLKTMLSKCSILHQVIKTKFYKVKGLGSDQTWLVHIMEHHTLEKVPIVSFSLYRCLYRSI